MAQAHERVETFRLREYFPAHAPREHDPHYAAFEAARHRLKAAGRLVCWVCGRDEAAAGQPIELHHAVVEFALANGVDLSRFREKFPEFHLPDDEAFFAWVESPANLLPLCAEHHRGKAGIHCLPYPVWEAQAFWKDDLPLPAVRE